MKRIVRNILIVIGTVLITALIFISVLYICLLHSFFFYYLDDIEIVTPAGNYSLVVKEWGFLRGGGAEIYYKQDDNLVLLGELNTDDVVHPFHTNLYAIQWDEERITIRYYSGTLVENAEDESTWRFKTFEVPPCQ